MPYRNVSVLIIDDDLKVKDEVIPLIVSWGAQAVITSNGYGGLDRMCLEHFDLILLGTDIPLLKSSDTLRFIKKIDETIPVIALVADESTAESKKVIHAGVDDVVRKPVDAETLKNAVEEVLCEKGLSIVKRSSDEKRYEPYNFQNIVGVCKKIRDILDLIKKVKDSDIAILIQGESGTGKELVARAVHFSSARKSRPFVSVSCAAIPESLLESELFGFEKGSFTGAVRQGIGRFEQADGGTLFLDEIGEMSPGLQAKFLRVIESGEFERIGGRETVKTDVRIISATNKDLKRCVAEKSFRDDLYYRISAFPIHIPPLRDRKEDIPILVDHFLTLFRINSNSKVKKVSKEALGRIMDYRWPGNIRELQNLLERITVVVDRDTIEPADLPPEIFHAAAARPAAREVPASGPSASPDIQKDVRTLDDMEKSAIIDAIASTAGNLSLAAKKLGIGRATLYRKAQKYGIPF